MLWGLATTGYGIVLKARSGAVTARNEAVSLLARPGSLLAASGRLGGAASGRYHVVIFTKRNPTKCSGRGYVSVGLRSCVAAPNLRLSKYQIHRQIAAPPSRASKLRATPAAGARSDEADVIARHKAIPKRLRRLPADVKGRLPRPFLLFLLSLYAHSGELATTKRTSPRGTEAVSLLAGQTLLACQW